MLYFYDRILCMEKVFLIFNTACIGDMLVTNTLVQNIKAFYPNSKVIFVCNSPFVDVAKYLKTFRYKAYNFT